MLLQQEYSKWTKQGVPGQLSWPPLEFCFISASIFKEQLEATEVLVMVKWPGVGF